MKDRIIVFTTLLIFSIIVVLSVLIVNVDPITLKNNLYTFELGETIPTNPNYYIYANEKVLNETQIHLVHVKDGIGDYPASLTYLDKEYPFFIRIKDTLAPTASLVQVKYDLFIGDSLKAMNMIKDVEDKTDVIAYFESDEKIGQKTYQQTGSFNERIVVEDTSGNKLYFRVRVNVKLDRESPILEGVEDREVLLGEPFRYFEGIKAMDNRDGDLTDSISVEGHVDIHTLGEYELEYIVVDSSGNRAVKTCVIKVVEELSEEIDY